MLRALLVVLVLANIGYCAWSNGALAGLGAAPSSAGAREPQRLQRQILPDALQIRPVTSGD